MLGSFLLPGYITTTDTVTNSHIYLPSCGCKYANFNFITSMVYEIHPPKLQLGFLVEFMVSISVCIYLTG